MDHGVQSIGGDVNGSLEAVSFYFCEDEGDEPKRRWQMSIEEGEG